MSGTSLTMRRLACGIALSVCFSAGAQTPSASSPAQAPAPKQDAAATAKLLHAAQGASLPAASSPADLPASAATRPAPGKNVAPTPSKTRTIAKPAMDAVPGMSIPMRAAGLPMSPNGYQDRGIKALAMPLDPKLVVFPYDPNFTYPVYSRIGIFTRIALQPNEKVLGFYLSDQVRWIKHVSLDRNSVFVMPTQDSPFNSGTLRTTLRDYELTFTIASEPDNWYQRVSWHIPASNFEEEIAQTDDKALQTEVDSLPPGKQQALGAATKVAAAAPGNTSVAAAQPTASDDRGLVRLENLNYAYEIEGNAPFKPTMVFDDGRQTWILMPSNQDAPVFFKLSKDGDGEPVAVTPHGEYVVISSLLPFGVLLKIGKSEVRIRNKRADCGFFGGNCWKNASARNIQQ